MDDNQKGEPGIVSCIYQQMFWHVTLGSSYYTFWSAGLQGRRPEGEAL